MDLLNELNSMLDKVIDIAVAEKAQLSFDDPNHAGYNEVIVRAYELKEKIRERS